MEAILFLIHFSFHSTSLSILTLHHIFLFYFLGYTSILAHFPYYSLLHPTYSLLPCRPSYTTPNSSASQPTPYFPASYPLSLPLFPLPVAHQSITAIIFFFPHSSLTIAFTSTQASTVTGRIYGSLTNL